MSARRRSTRLLVGLVIGMTLAVAACGGGGGSDEASPGTTPTGPTTDTGDDAGSIPDFTVPKSEFSEVDGSKARFINMLVDDGEGVDVDVYWGNNAETGKKATTVKYGEVSDWMTIEVEDDPIMESDDGKQDINVSFYKAGETDQESLIQQKSEPLDGDMLLTYAMGWTKTYEGSVGIPSSLSISYEHTAGDPPAGKAWVALNSVGIDGIEGGDFMVLSDSTGCQTMTSQDDIDTANNGQAFLVDPGTAELTASDANTDCSVKTDPVSIDAADGDAYVIYAYGTTMDDRQLLAVKVGE